MDWQRIFGHELQQNYRSAVLNYNKLFPYSDRFRPAYA